MLSDFTEASIRKYRVLFPDLQLLMASLNGESIELTDLFKDCPKGPNEPTPMCVIAIPLGSIFPEDGPVSYWYEPVEDMVPCKRTNTEVLIQ